MDAPALTGFGSAIAGIAIAFATLMKTMSDPQVIEAMERRRPALRYLSVNEAPFVGFDYNGYPVYFWRGDQWTVYTGGRYICEERATGQMVSCD